MNPRILVLLAIVLLAAFTASGQSIQFVANMRQWPSEVRFKAELPGGAVFLTDAGFMYSYHSIADLERIHDIRHSGGEAAAWSDETVHGHAFRVSLEGGNMNPPIVPAGRAPNYFNFFLGNDTTRWAGGVPAYERVSCSSVYPGIDMVVYSQGVSMKYDFSLSPGADPARIRLRYDGVRPELNADGDLVIRTSVNTVIEKAPVAYQQVGNRRQPVRCRYELRGTTLGFSFPAGYDRRLPLVIDPVLVFATYSGSTSTTFGWSATGDANGNLYAGGESFGTGWPVTTGAFQTSFGGQIDVGVNKYSSSGNALVYSTYFGGDSTDLPNSMVVNTSGELVMAGATNSPNFPTSSGCYDPSHNGNTDLYVVRFSSSGSAIIGSTYLGGSGADGSALTATGGVANRGEVICDSLNNIYLAFGTMSANFPTTPGAVQASLNGARDACVAKLSPGCTSLLMSTYLGGSGDDAASCMQRSKGGRLVVGGTTLSTNFPGTSLGWQPSASGIHDGFIAVLDSAGTGIQSATYVGSSGGEDLLKVQLDEHGDIYATGITGGGVFPQTPGVYNDSAGLNFIIKLDSTLGRRIVSTRIGSRQYRWLPSAFLVDRCSNIYFVGYGGGNDTLALTADALQPRPGGFWMCVLNPDFMSLRYASYFGAVGDHIDGGSSRLDPAGVLYHSICTNSSTLPTTSSSYAPSKLSPGLDIASWKMAFGFTTMRPGFDSPPDSVCGPATITFRNRTAGALSYRWDFGDGTSSTLFNPPPHTYSREGTFRIRLYAFNTVGCMAVDSVQHILKVFERDTVKLVTGPTTICGRRDSLRIPVRPEWQISVQPPYAASFLPTGGSQILLFPDEPQSYVITASRYGPCISPQTDTARFTLNRDTTVLRRIDPFTDTVLCSRDTAVYALRKKLSRLSIVPSSHVGISRDSLTLRFFPPVTTRYRILSLQASRCDTVRDTLEFVINREPVRARFDLSPRVTDQLDPGFTLFNRSTNASAYEWYLDQSFWTTQKSPAFTPADTGTYCFTLIAKNDFCADTADDCGRFVKTQIFMPNAFTPNGDGRNDILKPIALNTTILEFSVYNRWGQRVFVGYDNEHYWDGTFGGRPCDLGTYFYKVRYQVLNRTPQMLKGDVSLIR